MNVNQRQLLRLLAAYRRRLWFLTFVRHLPVGIAGAVLIGGAGIVWWHPAIGPSLQWAAASLAAVIGTIGIGDWVVRPSLMQAAAIIDRRLCLDDRVVTALQFASHDDQVSCRILKDATSRLALLTPRGLVADEQPRRRWLLGLCVAMSACLALAFWRDAVQGGGLPSDMRGPSATDGPAVAHADSAAGGPRSTSAAATPGATARTTPVERPRRDNEAPARNAERAAADPRADSPAPQPSAANADARPHAAMASNAAGDVPLGALASPGTPAATSNGRGSSRPGEHLSGGGAGSGGGTTTGRFAGSGGTTGGRISSSVAPPASASLPAAADYPSSYQNAKAQAEMAIAQDRIPPHFRALIRNYFTAIHPTDRQ
jgi:hypothetical protein